MFSINMSFFINVTFYVLLLSLKFVYLKMVYRIDKIVVCEWRPQNDLNIRLQEEIFMSYTYIYLQYTHKILDYGFYI